MASCNWCDQSGWFLSVDKNKLCKKCSYIITLDIQNRVRIITESMSLVRSSKKLDTRISRLELVAGQAKSLQPYENKGISLPGFVPSVLEAEALESMIVLIQAAIKEELDEAIVRAAIPGTSPKSVIVKLGKTLLKLRDYSARAGSDPRLEELDRDLVDSIHARQLQQFLGEAEKAEFKGQYKKALDLYRDALYFLKNDHIADEEQSGDFSRIEQAISDLEARI